jgi:preprotein translocase subunit SecY
MLEKLRVIFFSIPELRQKIILTLLLLAIFRIGSQVTLPMVKPDVIANKGEGTGFAKIIQQVSVLSASQLDQATIFGLGIMPYISASIILQLLGQVWKPLEELRKEGESGRRKINEYTRYLTVVLCLFQSWTYLYFYLLSAAPGADPEFIASSFIDRSPGSWTEGTLGIGWQVTAVMIMTCGTIFLMWLGEQIDEYGIGNGISILIMAGILARMPGAFQNLLMNTNWELGSLSRGEMTIDKIVLLLVLFVSVVVGVVFITLGQRRIPTQSAKHVKGRRVFGGNRQFLPLRINQSGVMPIIFASTMLAIPMTLFQWLSMATSNVNTTVAMTFDALYVAFLRPESFVHVTTFVALIFFFCFFWTAITFNPKEIAENLRDFGSFIPGYRPGKRTEEYLSKVMERITYVGAGFLSLVAIVPTIVSGFLQVDPIIAGFYGGTSLLIAVSVAFDLVQKIDNHLVMREYRGLLED